MPGGWPWDFFHQQYDSSDLKRGLFKSWLIPFVGLGTSYSETLTVHTRSFIMYVYHMYI